MVVALAVGHSIRYGNGERETRYREGKRENRILSMAASGAVPFWRSAGMTYITYSNICANLVRKCLKEPHKTEALSREKVHFSLSKWIDGKPEKPTIRSDTPEH